ncbi:cation transporter [bacterium]|nr:cation transporter [bacterium]
MDNQAIKKNEKKILAIIILTIFAMSAQVIIGKMSNSMALFSNGVHMAAHILVFGLTYAAYVISRKVEKIKTHSVNQEKIRTLAGYTSSVLLLITAAHIIFESAERLFQPEAVAFHDAIIVAVCALLINLFCIFIMGAHQINCHVCHCHDEHEDYNFKSAYMHVMADILTSLLTIAALITIKFTGITFLDALVGIISGLVIVKWAIGLVKVTVINLVDIKVEEKN